MAVQKYSDGKSYKVVAFCLSCFANEEQIRFIKVAQKISKEHNCKVVFFSTLSDFYYDDINDMGEKKIFDAIDVARFDAIVVMTESFKKEEDLNAMVERANVAEVPVYAIDKETAGCTNLTYDYRDSFKMVVKHMIEFHNYRRVNFMAGMKGNKFSETRLEAFKEVLEENGMAFEEERVYYGGFWEDPTKEAMEEMLASPLPMPEAIICVNDSMAHTVCDCLKEKGYRVPMDVAVSGFDGIVLEQYHRPRLTTVSCNYGEMIEIVFDMIEKEKEKRDEMLVICNKMQIGTSCGCNGLDVLDSPSEVVKIKYQLYIETRFHNAMNLMVSNLGHEEDLRKVISSIPSYLTLMNYTNLWCCINDDFIRYMTDVHREKEYIGLGRYDSKLRVYRATAQKPIDFDTSISFGDIVPELYEILESGEALMVVPLHLNGATVGYQAVSFDVDNFSYPLFSSYLVNSRYLMETHRNRIHLQDVYMKDALSGLLNRNGFNNIISRIMENNKNKGLLLISMDMDNLKKINDTYGHAEGDEALYNFATILGNVISRGELAARIGGDEFIITLVGDNVQDREKEIVKAIRSKLDEYNETSEKKYQLQASIGHYSGIIQENNLDFFMKRADELMYMDKYCHKMNISDIMA